ncbi:MAG: alpha/beta hydrolase [Candidatus Thorarchaeota archaeon]
MNIFLQIGIGVAGLIFIICITPILYKIYLRSSTKVELPNGISSLEEIVLGDLKQWIFIRGTDRSNPILLFLHGGPGEPVMGMSSSRKFDAELIKHFTVVHWDQRGAGKSYNPDIPPSSMTFDRLVEDCNELIDYLRKRFDFEKVFLVGHSGGTTIGIKTAHKYPEKLHAYVGVAQIINDFEQQLSSYNFILEEAERAGDEKALLAIKEIGPPPYETPKKEFDKSRYIDRYGGFMHTGTMKQMIGVMLYYLTSPEYSLSEAFRTIRGRGFHFTQNAMWNEITRIDFFSEIQSMRVPTYFFMGKYDKITPTALVENFYIDLVARKGKNLVIFEDSGHFLMIEEKQKYQDLLVEVVLKESKEGDQ